MDDFERQLREALERRPAPPALKRKLMESRRARRPQDISLIWQRLAASIVVASLLAGGFGWRYREQQRQGEEAREKVLTALRITSHALNQMNTQLAAHDHSDGTQGASQ
jgi:hypothetical protein